MIFCGDFNSLPVSSVLSAFLGEDILDENCSWKLPTETDFWTPKEDELKLKNEKYIQIAQLYSEKRANGSLDPLLSYIEGAYNCYNKPSEEID